jgi:hypothetical protein
LAEDKESRPRADRAEAEAEAEAATGRVPTAYCQRTMSSFLPGPIGVIAVIAFALALLLLVAAFLFRDKD